MKSISCVNLIKLTILSVLIVANYSASSKKSETVLDFFNDLFMGENVENENVLNTESSNLSKNFIQKNEVHRMARFRQVKNDQSINAAYLPKNGTMVQGWLSISSSAFGDLNRFPPIILTNGQESSIQVDENSFRKNELYVQNSTDPASPPEQTNFWFRLKDNLIFYSSNPVDINIMGSFTIDDILEDQDDTKFCMIFIDKEKIKWRLCSADNQLRHVFICAVKKLLKKPDYYCFLPTNLNSTVDFDQLPKPTVITDKLIQPIFLIPLASKNCNEKWNYLAQGSDWECECKEGMEQSPIDLPPKNKAILSPVTPLFNYEEVPAIATITTIDGALKEKEYIKIKYMKGALRIIHPNMGKIVTLDGAVYIAEEIVFHTPSEHTIEGRRFEMEMQVIHYGVSKGDIAKQVILSFLFEKKLEYITNSLMILISLTYPTQLFQKEKSLTIYSFLKYYTLLVSMEYLFLNLSLSLLTKDLLLLLLVQKEQFTMLFLKLLKLDLLLLNL